MSDFQKMNAAKTLGVLAERVQATWPTILSAIGRSNDHIQKIEQKISKESPSVVQDDANLVVFGSLARGEFVEGSDVDWTLLVDGQADPDAEPQSQKIESLLRGMDYRSPGSGGPFGALSFSHNLVHHIGLDEDSNRNTTRRILLLLESRPIGNASAWQRTFKAILKRYLDTRYTFYDEKTGKYKVPRFLLNDLVRYWRTMAVDFAGKQWDRGGQGWGIRNTKLRLSRKLIFASGLAVCFRMEARKDCAKDDKDSLALEFLLNSFQKTPLEILSETCLFYDVKVDAARKIFDAYDRFLAVLADPDKRKHIENLTVLDARKEDAIQQEVKDLAHAFEDGLERLFFDEEAFQKITRKYGVF